MTSRPPLIEEGLNEDISVLLGTLRDAEFRLDELTAGRVETGADLDRRSLALLRARGAADAPSGHDPAHLAAIRNALPAHILLVDTQGRSIPAGDAGRQLDCFDPIIDTNYGRAPDFTAVVPPFEGTSQIQRLAVGIRQVLTGRVPRYSCEYVSRSSSEEHWYLVTVTPMDEEYPTGAAVMYLDITRQARNDPGPKASGRTLDAAVDGVMLLDRAAMHFVHANDAACRLLGMAREKLMMTGAEEVLGRPRVELEKIYDALIDGDSEGRQPVEVFRPRADGSIAWFEVRNRAQYSAQGWTIVTFVRDISERKIAENRIAYLNRVHALLRGINTLIVHEHNRKNLMKKACRIAVEDGGFRLSLMAVVDRTFSKFTPVGLASRDKALLARFKSALVSDCGVPGSMMKRAIRDKRAVVSNDSRNDANVAHSQILLESGVRSVAVFPIIIASEVVGLLSLYADECQFFHAEELKVLTEMTTDVAFAIDHMQKQERLEYLACHDELTGLANRPLFMSRLTQLLRPASGAGGVALLLFDLRGFRNVNDSLGRPVGDALLKQVGEWLSCNVADTALLARVGVDHFAILMSGVERDHDVDGAVEALIDRFVAHRFMLGGAEFRISARVGISLFPGDGTDADSLMRHAEVALKKAKSSGDRHLFYTEKMSEAAAGKLSLETRLHQALDKDQFTLYYQPKIHLATGQMTGVEALIRWNDPHSGMVPPERFIGTLEETGMIHEVGRWVLRRAVEDHLRWRTASRVSVPIAVNVSPLQLRSHAFVREIERVIAIDPRAAGGLELEMTESLVMEDTKRNIESLRAIRDLGVTLAIDDFGTGFSSLSYLAKLPVHTLKIDRSFVTDMTAGPESIALVSPIIKLGHSMNLNVVAEGVETDRQSRLLRLLRCNQIQGYLVSMPMSRKTFEGRYLAVPVPA